MDRSHRYELWVIFLILLLFASLLYFAPAYYGYALMEDMLPEWFGFFLLATGIWYFGRAAVQRYRSHSLLGALFCTAMGILCLFVAGEEISWGQRLFGFTPPDYFMYRNVQREVTIHNLAISWMQPRRIALVFMLVYGILFPVACAVFNRLRHLIERIRIPVPTIGPAFGFAISSWLMTMPITMTDDEVGEVIFAFCLAIVALRASIPTTRVYYSTKKMTARVLAVSCLLSALCFLNPEHRRQVTNVGHLQAGMAYEGRGMMLKAAREYECLAEYWKTDWNLWVRVMTMYFEANDLERSYLIGVKTLEANNRLWRVYELLAQIGRLSNREDEVSSLFRHVLIDEPYNIFALHGLDNLNGLRWFYSAAREITVDRRYSDSLIDNTTSHSRDSRY